jgi:hypothetical protein
MQPDWFVTETCRALPERVRSIILFGSAVAGDFIEGVSGYDLLVVLDRLDFADLEALAPTIRRWHNAGHPLPLLFTPEQLASSDDAFAIEFLDMRQSRRVLYGSDPIASLQVDPAHARIHLERELKGKWLALRDQYVLAAGNPRRLARLLTDSFPTLLSLFRSVLRLYQPQVPPAKLDALQALTKHVPFDPQPFATIEELREGRRKVREVDMPSLSRQYLQAVETIITAVDRLLHPRSQETP